MKEKDRSIEFLKQILEICAKFGHNKDIFFRKISEITRIGSLKEKHVIQINLEEFDNDIQEAIKSKQLSKSDIDLLFLLKQRLSYEEVSVILGYKNVNSVYTKHARIKRKLKKSASMMLKSGISMDLNGGVTPEALIVMLMILLIICLAFFYFSNINIDWLILNE